MLRLIYSLAISLAAPFVLIATAWRGLADPAYRDRLAERYGYTRLTFATGPIWVHAVSVGEVQAASALVRELRKRYPDVPLLVTTTTPTGAQRVRALFGETVAHAFFPYDAPGAVRRFLDRVRPRIAIVMETEIWPNLFRECDRRRVAIVLANARLSEKSVRRYGRVASLFASALANDVLVAAQSPVDEERFRRIGATRSIVTGSIKFDLDVPRAVIDAGRALRAQFGSRPVWVAGSTHEGEETQVLAAHERLLAARPDALLILVPRHPNRFDRVAGLLDERRLAYARRSRGDVLQSTHAVLLGDTLGELVAFYAAADIAFVGGSLVPIGGHSLLEPASLAKPIVVGPHNFNARDIAQAFLAAGAMLEVANADELGKCIESLLADPARRDDLGAKALAIVEANRGALGRLLELVVPLLPPGSADKT